MSLRIDLLLAGYKVYWDVFFFRNFMFLSVCLPDPSTLMRYCMVKLMYFNDNAISLPFVWMGTSLVLDTNPVT